MRWTNDGPADLARLSTRLWQAAIIAGRLLLIGVVLLAIWLRWLDAQCATLADRLPDRRRRGPGAVRAAVGPDRTAASTAGGDGHLPDRQRVQPDDADLRDRAGGRSDSRQSARRAAGLARPALDRCRDGSDRAGGEPDRGAGEPARRGPSPTASRDGPSADQQSVPAPLLRQRAGLRLRVPHDDGLHLRVALRLPGPDRDEPVAVRPRLRTERPCPGRDRRDLGSADPSPQSRRDRPSRAADQPGGHADNHSDRGHGSAVSLAARADPGCRCRAGLRPREHHGAGAERRLQGRGLGFGSSAAAPVHPLGRGRTAGEPRREHHRHATRGDDAELLADCQSGVLGRRRDAADRT